MTAGHSDAIFSFYSTVIYYLVEEMNVKTIHRLHVCLLMWRHLVINIAILTVAPSGD